MPLNEPGTCARSGCYTIANASGLCPFHELEAQREHDRINQEMVESFKRWLDDEPTGKFSLDARSDPNANGATD